MALSCVAARRCGGASRRPEGYDEIGDSPTRRLEKRDRQAPFDHFSGPGRRAGGPLEGGRRARAAARRSSRIPHPLHGGTMHNKVVYRAVQALTRSGFATLRFNFRGVGLSEGRYDAGRGEIDDFRAALDEAERDGGPAARGRADSPSASAVGLQGASPADPRVAAFVGARPAARDRVGTAACRGPRVPALFVVGERDAFGPPEELARFVGGSGTDRRRAGSRPLLRGQPRGARRRRSRDFCRRCPSRRRPPHGAPVRERRARSRPRRARDLLDLARGTLEAHFRGEPPPRLASDRAETFGEPRGLFVTLRKDGELRGCIGTLAPDGRPDARASRSSRCAPRSRTRASRRSTPEELPRLRDRDLGPDRAASRSRARRRSRSAGTA